MKNLQGDIIAITNKNGKTVAEYSYDAWGVPTILSDSTGVIANINPYRYRSYYYDAEIGLYYLQSRYYDAVVGRFVNVDISDSLQEVNKILENNLFAYCQNDPVNEADYTGSLLASIIKKILLGVLKGFVGCLGLDFITFLYKVLLVDSNTKFVLSPGSEYLKAVALEVAKELLNPFKNIKFAVQLLNILGSYLVRIISNRMTTKEWVELVLKVAALMLTSYLSNKAEKKLNKQKERELGQLRKYRKKKSKNLNLKNQRRQIKLEFKKKGFKLSLKMDITEYVIDIFFTILTLV